MAVPSRPGVRLNRSPGLPQMPLQPLVERDSRRVREPQDRAHGRMAAFRSQRVEKAEDLAVIVGVNVKRGAGGDEEDIAHVLLSCQHRIYSDTGLLVPERQHHRQLPAARHQFPHKVRLPVAIEYRPQHPQVSGCAARDLPPPVVQQTGRHQTGIPLRVFEARPESAIPKDADHRAAHLFRIDFVDFPDVVRVPDVRMLSQAVVGVLHRRVLVVEGESHDGVEKGERKVGLVVVEDPLQKSAPRRHPELPVRQTLGKQPLHLLPGIVHGGPV